MLQNIQTGSAAHTDSYAYVQEETLCPRGKRPGFEAYHSPPYIFYAYDSAHRESISKNSNKMTLYSTLLFPVSRSTRFGHIPCPSSGAQLTVLTASGVDKQCVSSCRRGWVRTGIYSFISVVAYH
jgi:hypothetical protein